tara:strand:+ start:273 stop:419 length:147 start_codon:yes stop_codon:yes gene_type:complete
MMVKGVFDAIANMIATMFVLCCIFVPLGIWKLVEIIIWCYNHISIGIK